MPVALSITINLAIVAAIFYTAYRTEQVERRLRDLDKKVDSLLKKAGEN